MTRVKRGKTATKKRGRILKQTKGFRWGRKSKERAAREALLHALSRSFRGRKEKKRDFRAAWQIKINAGARLEGINYSQLMNGLKKANVRLDRKILADLAEHEPKVFAKVVEKAKAK